MMAGGKLLFILIFLISTTLTSAGQHDIYSGYSVHGVELRDREDLITLHELEHYFNLDVWQHGSPAARDAMVMVSPTQAVAFLDKLDEYGIRHYLHLADVALAFDEHDIQRLAYRNERNGRIVPFEDYPRYDEVNAYMEMLAEQYPNLVTIHTAGQSFEQRDIKYLKISTTNFNDASKPIYFLDAMIHAREWVTTPVALYTVHRLVEDLRNEDRDLLENIDWIVWPIVNPDGYEYTHTDERLWRRTRSYTPSVSTTCYGVDANRNFDVNFNTLGVSENPCSNTYPGAVAFSDVETQYIRDAMLEHLERIQLYLNIHSYGCYVLFGFGNASLPANAVQLHHVAATMGAEIDVLKLPHSTYYLVGNSNLVLYGTSGSAQDYGQDIGIPFSYTLELPSYGYDFRVPPEYISQINEETWRGIAATARLANTYYRIRRNDII